MERDIKNNVKTRGDIADYIVYEYAFSIHKIDVSYVIETITLIMHKRLVRAAKQRKNLVIEGFGTFYTSEWNGKGAIDVQLHNIDDRPRNLSGVGDL